jgi:hypothetical protein
MVVADTAAGVDTEDKWETAEDNKRVGVAVVADSSVEADSKTATVDRVPRVRDTAVDRRAATPHAVHTVSPLPPSHCIDKKEC